MKDIRTTQITSEILAAAKKAIHAAIVYQDAAKRKLGITGEVGEVFVCKILGLELASDNLHAGIDAIGNGKTYQIKTRRPERGLEVKASARLGSFSKHPYDVALLALLDDKYEVMEIYEASYEQVEPLLANHTTKRNPTLRQFKKVAHLVYKVASEPDSDKPVYQADDIRGNNGAFTCLQCFKVFIVNGMLDQKGRSCPNCQGSKAYIDITGKNPRIERIKKSPREEFLL